MSRPLALAAVIAAALVGIVTFIVLQSVALMVLAAVVALIVVIVVGRRLLPSDVAPTAPGDQVDEAIYEEAAHEEAMSQAPAPGVFPFDEGPIMDELPGGERHDH